MRLLTWETFVPDVEDNRARAARGEPALTVQIRAPTARVWRAFWLALAVRPDPTPLPPHLEALTRQTQGDPDAIRRGLTVLVSTMDDPLAEILWRGCVGAVVWPRETWPDPTTPPPVTCAALWALRDTLDSFGLYQSILDAVVDRGKLEAGTADFLASRSGPAALTAPAPPGTAASAADSA